MCSHPINTSTIANGELKSLKIYQENHIRFPSILSSLLKWMEGKKFFVHSRNVGGEIDSEMEENKRHFQFHLRTENNKLDKSREENVKEEK